MKNFLVFAVVALLGVAHAETSAPKKELIAKVLKAQQKSIEALAFSLVERPAIMIFQQAGMALQARVASERREAVAKEIQADMKKYLEEATPIVRERALKLAPTTIGSRLDDKFNDAELKQLVAFLESPVNQKFQQMAGELHNSLLEKLVGETRDLIEPKVKALEQSIAKRLGIPSAPAGAAPQPIKPPGK